ncbi:MAG: hypothetical protein AB7P07_12005 [Hyphomonadaceae bacterium]
MKSPYRLRIDTDAIAAFFAAMASWVAEALAFLGGERALREHLRGAVTETRAALIRSAAAKLAFAPRPPPPRPFHDHTNFEGRAFTRFVVRGVLPDLRSGSARERLARLKAVIADADAYATRIAARVIAKVRRFRFVRLRPTYPRALGACTAGAPAPPAAADTS